MKKIIFLLLFPLLLLSGCSYNSSEEEEVVEKHLNRDITRQEIESFVPVNYSLINKDAWSDVILVEKFIIDNEYFYFLPLLPYVNPLESSDTIKIFLLKYDNEKNKYFKIDEYSGSGNMNLQIMALHDIDNDGINEIFISFDENWGGSGTAHYMNVFKIDHKGIEEIFSSNNTITSLDLYDDPQRIMGASFIWDEGDSHFGCHYWQVNEYLYNNGSFDLHDTWKTKVKYDMGDEYEVDYKNCFPFPKDLNRFFQNERNNNNL